MNAASEMVSAVVLCNTCQLPMGVCACQHVWVTRGADVSLIALYSGVLQIGDQALKCHVLNNGERVFDAEDVSASLIS